MSNKFKKAMDLRAEQEPGPEQVKEETPAEYKVDFSKMIKKNKKEYKTYALYLNTSLMNEIESIAKKQKISTSKFVNDVLESLLEQAKEGN